MIDNELRDRIKDANDIVDVIGEYVTLMHLPMGIILPIFMLGFMTRFFGKNKSWMEGFRAWKYCIMASVCFLVPYLILAWTVGPELPSMVGGLLGLGALVWLTKKGFCVPTDGVWDFARNDEWDPEWTGSVEASSATEYKEHMSQTMAWLPYVLCGLLLVLTRVPAFHLKPIVTDPIFSVGLTNILGYQGVTSKIALLNLPGTIPFILVSIITIGLHKMSGEKVRQAWGTALEKMSAPTIALVAAVALVSILKGSGVNTAGPDGAALPSMPMAMAMFASDVAGGIWPMLAAVVASELPVGYSAVTDPAAAGFDGGENMTGTSDALNTAAIMNLILAADPEINTIGLLYDLSQDSSTQAIADAKAFCDEKGIQYIEKNGTTTAEVQMAAEALVAAGGKAVFTPTDNTIMTAELSIYETFTEAGVMHFTGADSFALNGAFVGYGVDYVQLGEATADMVAEILCDGKSAAEMPYQTFDNGIVTINTETAAALGFEGDKLDALKEAFKPYCTEIVEVTTAQNFS